jgi:hypothetical protein
MEPRGKLHPDTTLKHALSRAREPGLAEVSDNRDQFDALRIRAIVCRPPAYARANQRIIGEFCEGEQRPYQTESEYHRPKSSMEQH